MKKVSINMFGRFRVLLNDKELPFSKSSSEFLALLVCFGGGKVTAKNDWECVFKDEGKLYSAKYYVNHISELQEELALFGLSDIIHLGTHPVRSCRLILDKVNSDYFDMLNNEKDAQPKELFLPNYEWAQKMYCNSWDELRDKTSM